MAKWRLIVINLYKMTKSLSEFKNIVEEEDSSDNEIAPELGMANKNQSSGSALQALEDTCKLVSTMSSKTQKAISVGSKRSII